MYRKFFKRVIDVFIAALGLLIGWPVILLLVLLVRIKLGSPVLFCQERPGYKGKVFKLYKFRSMTDERDENGKLLPASKRTTKFGSLLRSTSLDELPEIFINVLKGEMSLIGPRPLATQYLDYYTDEEMRRHDVLPGLTGLAQVKGRNNLPWEDRFALDIEYVDNLTFKMDVYVFFMTIVKIFKREDVADARVGVEENFDTYRKKQLEEAK